MPRRTKPSIHSKATRFSPGFPSSLRQTRRTDACKKSVIVAHFSPEVADDVNWSQ